jgi:hypothetical protein
MWSSRPSGVTKEFFDVQPHHDDEMSPESNCEYLIHFGFILHSINDETDHVWKYKFALECLSQVQVRAFSVSPPSHSTVLALSQQVENYPAFMPAETEINRQQRSHTVRMMQMELSRGHKEDVLLHMHRPFCLLGLSSSVHMYQPMKSFII